MHNSIISIKGFLIIFTIKHGLKKCLACVALLSLNNVHLTLKNEILEFPLAQINKHQNSCWQKLRTESTVGECTVTVGNSSIPPRVPDKISRMKITKEVEERKDTIE